MRIQIAKWRSLAVLVFAMSVAAAVAAFHAYQAKRNRWFPGFVTIAAVFGMLGHASLRNPAEPTLRLSGAMDIALVASAMASFATLAAATLLAMASITDRTPRSQPLRRRKGKHARCS